MGGGVRVGVVTEECSGENSLKLGTKVQVGAQYDWLWGMAKAFDLTTDTSK